MYHKACTKHFPVLLCTTPMQHSCSHYNAFCNITWQTPMYLRTWQHKMTTIMQAFQCNLQPEIPQTHRTTHTHKHTQSSLKPQLQCGKKNVRTNVPATASHTSCPSSPPAATLYRKTQGFVLRLPPQHKPHATFTQPAQCDLPPGIPQAHRSTHTRRHTKCRTPRENQKSSKRACPQPPHARAVCDVLYVMYCYCTTLHP